MKKERINVILGIVALILIILILIISGIQHTDKMGDKTVIISKKSSAHEREGGVLKPDFYKEEKYANSDVSITENTKFKLGLPVTHENMRNICMEYLYKIPFLEDGRYFGIGYSVSMNVDGMYNGLDSIGWLIFAYRNLTGETSVTSKNPVEYYTKNKNSRVQSISELEIGDIGMISLNETDNHFGIFVGFYNENPVFVHCSNEPDSVYNQGCVRMSYLQSVCDYYIEGSAPVDFQYFVRPDIKWED